MILKSRSAAPKIRIVPAMNSAQIKSVKMRALNILVRKMQRARWVASTWCMVVFKTVHVLKFLIFFLQFYPKAKFHVALCHCKSGYMGSPFLECVPVDVMRQLAKQKQNRPPFQH